MIKIAILKDHLNFNRKKREIFFFLSNNTKYKMYVIFINIFHKTINIFIKLQIYYIYKLNDIKTKSFL